MTETALSGDRRELAATAAVVGGGPAGLMAAEVLAAAGLSVTVHDHRRSFGRKLVLAGRGGLNLTHIESFDRFRSRYGPAEVHLEHALGEFGPAELRAWCADLGDQSHHRWPGLQW